MLCRSCHLHAPILKIEGIKCRHWARKRKTKKTKICHMHNLEKLKMWCIRQKNYCNIYTKYHVTDMLIDYTYNIYVLQKITDKNPFECDVPFSLTREIPLSLLWIFTIGPFSSSTLHVSWLPDFSAPCKRVLGYKTQLHIQPIPSNEGVYICLCHTPCNCQPQFNDKCNQFRNHTFLQFQIPYTQNW